MLFNIIPAGFFCKKLTGGGKQSPPPAILLYYAFAASLPVTFDTTMIITAIAIVIAK